MGHAPVLLWAATGGVLGWALVPKAADVLLRRAYRRSASWWWDCCHAYRRFKRAHPEREPSRTASGEEGALGLWLEDALRSAREGGLARERTRALADAGLVVDEAPCIADEATRERTCSFEASRRHRAACAAACALAFAVLGFWSARGTSAVQAIVLGCCAVAMAVAVVCDLKARTLPLETCVVLAVAGTVFQLLVGGAEGVMLGAAAAAVVAVGCLGANRVFERRGKTAVGYGDVRCMVALSLASGAAAPAGFAACYACAAAFSLGGMVVRRLTPSSGIPMAPFLALWLLCGAAVSVSA